MLTVEHLYGPLIKSYNNYFALKMFLKINVILGFPGNNLDGTPQYFFSPGSHGNLNSDISTGGTLEIPDAVGTWVTTLEPITITLSGTTVDVPGLIGVIYVLMDEHDTPDSDVDAGHQAFNTMVSSQFNQFISGIELDAVGVEVQDVMTE
jgi:hypothetical protein